MSRFYLHGYIWLSRNTRNYFILLAALLTTTCFVETLKAQPATWVNPGGGIATDPCGGEFTVLDTDLWSQALIIAGCGDPVQLYTLVPSNWSTAIPPGLPGGPTSAIISGNGPTVYQDFLSLDSLVINGSGELIFDTNFGLSVTGASFENSSYFHGRGVLAFGPSSSGHINYPSGVIEGDSSSGGVFEIVGGDLGFINEGFLLASGNGTLSITDVVLENNGGVIEANTGGTLRLFDGDYNNTSASVIRAVTGGTVEIGNSGTYSNPNFVTDTLMGSSIRVVPFTIAHFDGTVNNESDLIVETNAFFQIADGVDINGFGTLSLAAEGSLILGDSIGGQDLLTNGASHTIEGSGNIGSNRLGVINHGIIDANNPVAAMSIDPDSQGVTNSSTGILKASDGGTLKFLAGIYTNNGLIKAFNGSVVELKTDAKFLGGIFESSGIGEIQINAGDRPIFGGSITNNGVIRQNGAGGAFADLRIDGYTTLSGTGELILNGHPNTRLLTEIPGSVLTQTAGHTINGGAGLIDVELINEGTIQAEGAVGLTFNKPVTNNGSFDVAADSQATFNSKYSGSNGITGTGPVLMNDELSPGESTDSISFGGDLIFGFFSSLRMEIGGPIPGSSFDQVNVAGTVSLSGSLVVDLIDGFFDTLSESYTILTADTLAGAFNNVADGERIDTIGGEGSFLVNYDNIANNITLTAFETNIASDFNNDNYVGGLDFLAWQRGFGNDAGLGGIAPKSEGNANGDQFIDSNDLVIWESQFGTTLPPLSVLAVATPEPSTLLLASLTGLLICSGRRRC